MTDINTQLQETFFDETGMAALLHWPEYQEWLMTEFARAPGVQLAPPPPALFTDIKSAIDGFVLASLAPGKSGGMVGIATKKGDSVSVNIAIVQTFGKDRDHAIVGWIGKEGSWGSPIEGGLMWKSTW